MKKSAAAAQQLGSVIGDPASIGAKLMSKMGFGVAGQGLGRAGQVRYAPHGHHVHVQSTACALLTLPLASLQALSYAALPSSRCTWQSKVVSFIKLSGTKRAASLLSTCGLRLQAYSWLLIFLDFVLVRALLLQWRQSRWARGRAWALSASARSGLGLQSATAPRAGGVLERIAPGRGPPHGAGQHPAPGQLTIGTCLVAARSASLRLSPPAMECIGPDQLASDPRSECKTICVGSDCLAPVSLQIPVTRL